MSLWESLHRWQDRAVWGTYVDAVRMPGPELQSWFDELDPGQRRAIALQATSKDPPPAPVDAHAWGAVVDAYLAYQLRSARLMAVVGLPLIMAALLPLLFFPGSRWVFLVVGFMGSLLGTMAGGILRADRLHRRRRDLADRATQVA